MTLTAPMSMTTRREQRIDEIITAAADSLDHKGKWLQGDAGDIHDPDAPHCALGALYAQYLRLGGMAEGWNTVYAGAMNDRITRALNLTADSGTYIGLTDWNDNPGRKRKEVVALLRKAAEL